MLVARPYVWGLGLAGEAGVAQVVRGLLADFDLTAGMCGAATLADVGPPLVVPAGRLGLRAEAQHLLEGRAVRPPHRVGDAGPG